MDPESEMRGSDLTGDGETTRTSIFGPDDRDQVAAAGGVPYKDDMEFTKLGWVQTPIYYEDCFELEQLGDPCGHRNALYFDAVQCGFDGYGSATLNSTNAIIRRAAIDSVGGFQYGSFTEGQLTGLRMHRKGWDSAYFRKDWEGDVRDPDSRFPLITGIVPESVAATMRAKKNTAQGLLEIAMHVPLTHGLIDEDWWAKYQVERPMATPSPKRTWPVWIMRFVIYFNEFYSPLSAIQWCLYVVVVAYMLFACANVFYLNPNMVIGAYMPYIIMCAFINRLATRPAASMDSVSGAETCFSMAWCTVEGFLAALFVRITCVQGYKKAWQTGQKKKHNCFPNTTAFFSRTSLIQLPNVLAFFTLIVGLIFNLYMFFNEYYNTPWEVMPAFILGVYIVFSLLPVVRMTIQEFFGWAPDSLADKGDMSSAVVLALLAAWASLWKYFYVSDQGTIMF